MNKPHPDFSAAIEFEECLLGSILLEPTHIDAAVAIIHPAEFYDESLSQLFGTLITLHEAGKPIGDIKLVSSAIKSRGVKIEPSRLAEMFTKVPSPNNWAYYANEVSEASRRRRLFKTAASLIQGINDPSIGTDDLVNGIETQIESLRTRQSSHSHALADVAEKFKGNLSQPEQRASIMTGIPKLDDVTGGFRPGEMVTIAARPGCGKTALGVQIAEHVARQLRSVMFASLEMTAAELFSRMVCANSNIDSTKIRTCHLSENDKQVASETADQIAPFSLHIFDPPKANIKEIRAESKLISWKHGLDLLVVDYLGLLRPLDPKLRRFEQVAEDSKEIKRIAKELGIPVIALCQLNRDADGKKPVLSQLRDSGSIEQDSDIVILLHRCKSDGHGLDDFNLIVAKHRHGQIGQMEIRFDTKRTRFTDEDFSWKP